MNVTVRWREPASTEMLAQLVRAADKQEILGAGREIERRLQRRPHTEGEERNPGERMLFVRPLSVLYTVDDVARTVYIERVKWVGW